MKKSAMKPVSWFLTERLGGSYSASEKEIGKKNDSVIIPTPH